MAWRNTSRSERWIPRRRTPSRVPRMWATPEHQLPVCQAARGAPLAGLRSAERSGRLASYSVRPERNGGSRFPDAA